MFYRLSDLGAGEKVPEDKPMDVRDMGLIDYLARHGHESPFWHCQLTFRIRMPVAVARQWFRSTVGLARNEVSRRYVQGRVAPCVP